MGTLLSKYCLLVAAVWYTGNGLLHDTFVLLAHKKKYDRELLRLLMDGHVLLLSGALMCLSYMAVSNRVVYGAWIGIITTLFMLIYCMMIFPFLRSVGTIIITIITLIVCIRSL